MNNSLSPRNSTHSTARAFTVTELLVVIGILALWASLLVPALGRTQGHTRNFVCLHNLHQLMTAMLMYTHEHRELFPPNPDDGNTVAGHNWCQGMAGAGGSSEFNADVLKNPAKSLLTPYVGTNVALFRCSADTRRGRSTGAGTIGTLVPPARSISMNQAVGTVCSGYSMGAGHSGIPTLPVNGSWLTGSLGQNHSSGPWRTYAKTSGMLAPPPSRLWVLIEENPWSENDAAFAVSAGLPEWVDFPGLTHNTGCCLAFGDGHAELHKWVEKSTLLSAPWGGQAPMSPQDRDWAWLAARTSLKLQ